MTMEIQPPPDAERIERRFRSPAVALTRPLVLGGVRALKIVRRFGWSAQGIEVLDGLTPPIVFAANHCSHADTAAILGTLPRELRRRTAVAAALDVFGQTTRGRTWANDGLQLIVAAGFHAFPFDRHGPPLRSIRTSVQLIRGGWSLLLYPEGTRSRTGALDQFKPGVGLLARFGGRPVVPVHVEGGRAVQPYGAFLPNPGHITVRFGAPMWYRESDTPAAFTQRLREQVCLLRDQPAEKPVPQRAAALGSKVA